MGYPIENSTLTVTQKEELTCPVCLDLLENAERIVPCGHAFCKDCLQHVLCLGDVDVCPVCRQPREGTMSDFMIETLIRGSFFSEKEIIDSSKEKMLYPFDDLLLMESSIDSISNLHEITDGRNVSFSTHENPFVADFRGENFRREKFEIFIKRCKTFSKTVVDCTGLRGKDRFVSSAGKATARVQHVRKVASYKFKHSVERTRIQATEFYYRQLDRFSI